MIGYQKILSMLGHDITKERELELAYRLADVGAIWKIEQETLRDNTYFWPDQTDNDLQFLPFFDPLEMDVLNSISEKSGAQNYQPRGNYFIRARTNFLYLTSAQLSDDNPMRGKTVLQVRSTTVKHCYIVVTKLAPADIIDLQHGMNKLSTIRLSAIKKRDPSLYIIDSWAMGYFNEPQLFVHWSPYIAGDIRKGLAKHPTTVVIDGVGIVGNPEQEIMYYNYAGSDAQYIQKVINQPMLNHPAWKNFQEKVSGRVVPKDICAKMVKEYAVITYFQIPDKSITVFDKNASKVFGSIISASLAAAIAMGICLFLDLYSITIFGFGLLIDAAMLGGIGFLIGMAIGIGIGGRHDSSYLKELNINNYLQVNSDDTSSDYQQEDNRLSISDPVELTLEVPNLS